MGEAHATSDAQGAGVEVMASVDAAGRTSEFVIADICREEAWLSMPDQRAPALDDWR
jgi:hypothetical protein